MQAPPPFEERALVRWAEEQAEAVAHGPETLDWMAREGEGEKLEAIAREAELPSARVRQRVSRLRRWMKGRYLAELALASSLALALAWLWGRHKDQVAETRVTEDAPAPSASVANTAEIDQAAREQRQAASGSARNKIGRAASRPSTQPSASTRGRRGAERPRVAPRRGRRSRTRRRRQGESAASRVSRRTASSQKTALGRRPASPPPRSPRPSRRPPRPRPQRLRLSRPPVRQGRRGFRRVELQGSTQEGHRTARTAHQAPGARKNNTPNSIDSADAYDSK